MDLLGYISWNVNPDLISSPITIKYYSLLMALAFVVGFNLTKRMYDNENAEEGWLDKKLIYAVVATVVGARLGHVFFYEWEYYSQNLGEIVQVWKGGLASHGAAIALILAMWIYAKKVTKKSVFWGLDKLVIMVALAGFFIRSGNLMNSEIIGGKSESDVAIFYKYSANTSFKNTVARSVRYMYPAYESAFVDEANIEGTNEVLEVQGFKYKKGNYRIVLKDNLLDNRLIVDRLFEVSQKGYDEAEDHYFLVNSKADVQIVDGKAVITGELAIVPRIPTQVWEAIAYLFSFIILFWGYWKKKWYEKEGLIFGVFLILVFGARFVIEFWKEHQAAGIEEEAFLNMGQWLSIPLVLIGVFLVFRSMKK